MKHPYILFFFLHFIFISHSQNNEVWADNCDNNGYIQTSKKIISIEKALENAHINPNRTIEYANTLLKKTENSIEIIKIHELLSRCYEHLHNEAKAHEEIRIAYQLLDNKLKYTNIGVTIIKSYAYLLKRTNAEYSLKLFKESVNVLDSICNDANIMRFVNISEIANIHLDNKQFILAKKNYLIAQKEAKRLKDKLFLSSSFNNFGIFYANQNLIPQALKQYDFAKKELDTTKIEHHLFYVNIEENIANILLHKKKKYNKAAKIYKHISKVRYVYNQKEIAIYSDISLLNCYIETNNKNKVNELFNKLDRHYNKINNIDKILNLEYSNYLNLKLLFYKNNNLYQDYINTSDLYINFLNNKFKYESKLFNQVIIEYDKYQNFNYENEISLNKKILIEKEKLLKKRKWIFISSILLALLIIITLLLLIKIRNTRYEKAKQKNIISNLTIKNNTLEKEKLNQQIINKEKDILSVVRLNKLKLNYLKNLLNKIAEISKKNNISHLAKPIIMDIKSQINIEERLLSLKSDLTNVNASFENKLIKKYPQLSKTEREICSFIKLNLNTKEIAQIRNSSIDAIKMARSRIRKKLNISPNEELEKFIQSI